MCVVTPVTNRRTCKESNRPDIRIVSRHLFEYLDSRYHSTDNPCIPGTSSRPKEGAAPGWGWLPGSTGAVDSVEKLHYDEIMRRADEELDRQFKSGIISRRVYEGTKSRTPYQRARLGGAKTQPREDDGLSHQEPERGSGSRRGPPQSRAAGEERPAVTPATPEPPSSVRSKPSSPSPRPPANHPSADPGAVFTIRWILCFFSNSSIFCINSPSLRCWKGLA